ncbi:MAG: acylphosphatase [Ilumatobacteraceae bacterium]|nr:acylphosphatase [Ilumatobacteraceae bacterium]
MTDEVARARVVAHGRVQGVWYRDTCRQYAQREGLAGWVRNCGDGVTPAAGVSRRSRRR